MADFVSQRVQRIRDAPTAGASVELVVGISEDGRHSVSDWIEAHGGTVHRDPGFDMLYVRLPEPEVDDLCALSAVESVEFNEPIEVHGSGPR